jgi:hypothetical protein
MAILDKKYFPFLRSLFDESKRNSLKASVWIPVSTVAIFRPSDFVISKAALKKVFISTRFINVRSLFVNRPI